MSGNNFEELTIPGDTAYFFFHTDASRTDWGFRAIVKGKIRKSPELEARHVLRVFRNCVSD